MTKFCTINYPDGVTIYPDGRVQTLNGFGGTSPAIDPITGKYLEFLSQKTPSATALEIAACYGPVTLNALANTTANIVANDLDSRHIKILQENAQRCFSDQIHRLKTDVSNFPEDFNTDQKFDAILFGRAAHYFSPAKLANAIDKFSQLLKPSGCVYLVAISPYVARFASFIPEYEQRLADGQAYPGFIPDLQCYADKTLTPDAVYIGLKNKEFHFLDAEVLSSLFEAKGFKVSYVDDFPLSYYSAEWTYDGRENTGIIACMPEKPLGLAADETSLEL